MPTQKQVTYGSFLIPNTDQRGIIDSYSLNTDFNEASKYIDPTVESLVQFGTFPMSRIDPGGVYRFGAGNVGAPAISWASDTATGFYLNAAGDMRVSISGTYEVAFNSSGIAINDMTQGSVLFAGPNGQITQDNANLFWNDTTNRLGIGTTGPNYKLDIWSATTQLGLSNASGDSTVFWATTSNLLIISDTATQMEYQSLEGNGQIRYLSVYQSRNAGVFTADAQLYAHVVGASSGDPMVQLGIDSVRAFALGIDNSDSDKFKISYAASSTASLGTNDYLTIYTTGDVAFGTGSFYWDNTTLELKFGSGPTSHIFAAGTTSHGATNTFAEFGEGRALGNPTGTVTMALGAAGALTGAYKYAYYEKDVDGNATGLSPISATINPVAQRVTVTIPRARPGVATRILCRTVAGGSNFFQLATFGPSYEFHQTVYSDNTADGSLGGAASTSDSSILYKCSIRRGETLFCAHPDQAGTTHDIGILTGNPGTAGEWAVDSYGTIVARESLGICFYSIHTGTANYHLLADYNSDTFGSTVFSVFKLFPRGEIEMAPVAYTSGSPNMFLLTAPAHTGLTASTENATANWNFSATKTFAAGALTLQREMLIQAPTYAFASASTVTSAATLAVTGEPLAGSSATISNAYGIMVGTPEAPVATGIHQLGLFYPGTTQSIMRNTTDNLEMHFILDSSDGYFGMGTNHNLRLRTNNSVRMILENAARVTIGSTLNLGGNLGRAFNIEATAAGIAMYDGTQAANEKIWEHYINGTTLTFRTLNDAISAATNWLTVTRSANTITGMELTTTASTGDIYLNAFGKVKFGTHTALGAETVTGYITIKDSGGTTRKLAVVS